MACKLEQGDAAAAILVDSKADVEVFDYVSFVVGFDAVARCSATRT
jgi:hypothetical protein